MNSADKYKELGNGYHWKKARNRRSAYKSWVERVLQELPEDGRQAALLDVGCGDGYPASRLVARNYQLHGVDPLPGPLQVARRRVPRATFTTEYPDHPFDFVLALESLEHIRDTAPLVQAVRLCRQYAVVTVPEPGIDEFALRDWSDEDIAHVFSGCRVTSRGGNDYSRIFCIEP